MHPFEDEEIDVRQQVAQSVQASVVRALAKLAAVAAGADTFGNDHELRACVAIARLAPLLFIKGAESQPVRSPYHPDHSPEEVQRLLRIVYPDMYTDE